MKIIKTKIKDLLIIKKETFKDKRGFLRELYRENLLSKKFIFEIISYSRKNVIRGLHLQAKNSQGKYVSVLKGKAFDVAVDLRKGSKTFGQYFSIILSEKQNVSFYIPEGFAHGFQSLSDDVELLYLHTEAYSAQAEAGLRFDDEILDVKWPLTLTEISERDQAHSLLTSKFNGI